MTAYIVACTITKKRIEDKSIDEDNPYLKAVEKNNKKRPCGRIGLYESVVKSVLDKILSFAGIVVLHPIMGAIALAVYLDDPGPVFFTQKRVGKDGLYFMLHKYRSMKMSTPHDVPTHELSDPEQYITKVGGFLRRTSLDELPQIWDIFRGKMSIIGPRPALWNQYDLVDEREKYGANNVLPGLTGLAQIKGRDELLISDKAKLDGEYAKMLHKGGGRAFFFDLLLFLKTVGSVLRHDGVVEGGTGKLSDLNDSSKKVMSTSFNSVIANEVGFEDYGYKKTFSINKEKKVKVLITGAGSYIGESFVNYCKTHFSNIEIRTIDMEDSSWQETDFSCYDTIFHVAGIAHADVGHTTVAEQAHYYRINTDLAIEVAEKAKKAGVKQFILMSSMIIYGGKKYIDEYTIPVPLNFYGDSKWQADKGVRGLAAPTFHVAVLRPPMIYGKGSRGNYPMLSKIARKVLAFPDYENCRSMLYIDNLSEFLGQLVCSGEGGIYFPQNKEYTKTSSMVEEIGKAAHRHVHMIKGLNPVVRFATHVPGKIGNLTKKAFGSSYYSQHISTYEGLDYQKTCLADSIKYTESIDSNAVTAEKKKNYRENKLTDLKGKRVLLIALPGYRDGILAKMRELGAEVDLINDKPNEGFICKALGRYKIRFYQQAINDYYKNRLELLKNRDYDYILSIRGEYTPIETLKLLKSYYPKSKLILYMWDGLGKLNTKGIEEKWQYYDRVYTFDRIDYENHKAEISFLPLYYYEDYLPKEHKNPNSKDFTYDLSFIGTGHNDRIRIVKDVMKQCRQRGLTCFSYFFMPHQLVFLKNKVLNQNFKNVSKSDIKFEMMPFERLYEIYADSRCIVDVENQEQHGLTMRSIEILGLRRKFITTNKDIVNYDFYNPNNVLVLDRDNPVIDFTFFMNPYEELDKEIYKKYSLSNWIFEVLK